MDYLRLWNIFKSLTNLTLLFIGITAVFSIISLLFIIFSTNDKIIDVCNTFAKWTDKILKTLCIIWCTIFVLIIVL